MTSINTNIGALSAQANMTRVNDQLNTAMQRLSTGLRINAAKDDAAGMAIGEKMTSQIMGLNQAVRNATDGKNLIDTTESAHVEVSNMLQRLRELAVQSSNDTNTSSDRGKIAAESKALINEVNRVAETTTFNGMKVLDGSFSGKQFQIGADGGQTMSINVGNASARALGSNQVAGLVQVDDGTTPTAAQAITVAGSQGTSVVNVAEGASAKDAAAAINGVTGSTGVTATAVTKAELSGVTAGTMTFTIAATNLDPATGSGQISIGNVKVNDTADLTVLRDAINNVSAQTGVTATFGDTKGKLQLTSSSGETIKLENMTHSDAAGEITVDGLDSLGKIPATAVQSTLNATTNAVVTGTVDFSSDKSFTVSSDAAGFAGTAAVNSGLSSVADIDLSTKEGSAKAIEVLDMAIEKISSARSDLGAVSNRLDSTISNLTNISTSVQAARSQVMDADFAAESTNLARGQILSQASTAMLAQANASKQNVMSLLRG